MSYDDLEKAARETSFTSDVINHAYTLALFQAGDNSTLADVAFQIGSSLAESDRGAAMDYFQRALLAGLGADRVDAIGRLFETWAAPLSKGTPLQTPVHRVAHVVGSLSADDPLTRYLTMLVASLKAQEIESTIFTTETTASWFINPKPVARSQSVRIEAEVMIATTEGDFEERARRIAEAIRESGIAVAFFYSNLAEQITSRVASMRPAPVQIHVNLDSDMRADLFNAHIHLSENARRRSKLSGPAACIPPVSDIESSLRMHESATRQSLGLGAAASASATFGRLENAASREYLRVLAEIMTRFPNHFHLFAGTGNVRTIRPYLHSEGVLPRVRFLAPSNDVAPLLQMIDVYLTPFPDADSRFVLEAMAASKPVVVRRFAADSPHNTSAELVGIPELAASKEMEYIEITDRLLRNSAFRAEQGQAVFDRFRVEFRPARLGERYKAFIASLESAGSVL